MTRERYSYAQQKCLRGAGKLMQHTQMLHPGARVGVAVSGGVDSWVLLATLHLRRRIVPFPYEIIALHLNPGFDTTEHAPLEGWLRANGVAGHIEVTDYGPRGHSDENRQRSACFYCAWLRRKRLFELCQHYKLSHLAFGHNADDLVGTFFLNLLQSARVQGMSMKESFFRGDLTVIRPLLQVEKTHIIKAATRWELPVWNSPCPSAKSSGRAKVMAEIAQLCNGVPHRQRNLYRGLTRWQYALTMDKLESALDTLDSTELEEN